VTSGRAGIVTNPPVDQERQSRLLGIKLAALVHAQTGADVVPPAGGGLAGAAAVVLDGEGWFLADRLGHRALGRALAWARQAMVSHLHVVIDDGVTDGSVDVAAAASVDGGPSGALARRALAFAQPPSVWRVEGRRLAVASPSPPPGPIPTPEGIDTLVELLRQSGLEVTEEHGVVAGELDGLEVARIVVGEGTGPRLEVGVGRNDREAFTLLHGELPRTEALAAVVDAARIHRRASSPGHPLTRLAPERWLRRRLLEVPALVGAIELTPVAPIVPRRDLREVVPALAVGRDGQGAPVVAACSVGVDLDLVPEAADVRERETVETAAAGVARLVLVVPERDALPVTRDLAAALRDAAEVVAVPGDWRQLGDVP
jgi:hypothetical protein